MSVQRRIGIIGVLILTFAAAHYSCRIYVDNPQWHYVFYKFLCVPILLSAYWLGLRGGLIAGLTCTLIYSVDRVIWWNPEIPFYYNQISDLFLFLATGVLLGYLVDLNPLSKHEKYLAQVEAADEHHKTITDPLTHAYNRRHLDATLKKFWEIAAKGGGGFSLLMVDINRFKQVNDHFGHVIGDRVLQATVQTILNNTRKTDLVFRYEGDEFLIFLPMTPGSYALGLANRLREEIAKMTFKGLKRESFKIDFSIGVIEYHADMQDVREIFSRLDKALYRAKQEDSQIALAGSF